ncbi:MAG: Unknown protein [uncultured Sulfurovum sp.]|uniref:Uncharacterized protein n=1 Tax=uncultured Sulfurovum sp. TaxID=269237 RepID=A0A6S6T0T6_9BACT|nr:MAG: Unknown protein [uncultured Sulfurovum sp.]
MKRIVFMIASRRLEVELEDDFADYVSKDLLDNKVSLERDNEVSQLLQLYLKTIHKEYQSEEQIKILLNNIEDSN